jgi:hypothetical protein
VILIVTVAVVAGVTSVVGAVTAYRAGNVLLARGSRSAASRPVAAFTALLLVVAGCTAWQALSRPHLTPCPTSARTSGSRPAGPALSPPRNETEGVIMCRAVTCKTCGKITWAGCASTSAR